MRSVIFMMNRVKKQSTRSNNAFPKSLCVCVSQMRSNIKYLAMVFVCVCEHERAISNFLCHINNASTMNHLARFFVYLHFVTFMARHNQSSWRDVRACRVLLFSLVRCHKKLSDKNVQWKKVLAYIKSNVNWNFFKVPFICRCVRFFLSSFIPISWVASRLRNEKVDLKVSFGLSRNQVRLCVRVCTLSSAGAGAAALEDEMEKTEN